MAVTATLYRFQIELSDINRGVYETIAVRTAQHPSESTDYLLTRVLAYALNYDERLEFSPQGLADPDAPALRQPGEHGTTELCIEIGNPSARRLHRSSKASKRVKVYTYKDPAALLSELSGETVHRQDEIEIYALPASTLESLAETLERDNRWGLLYNDGLASVTTPRGNFDIEITKIR